MSERICCVEGCQKPSKGRECVMHAHRRRRLGSYDLPPKQTTICRADGCDSVTLQHELCVVHWGRFLRTGDVVLTRQRQLKVTHSAGYVALYLPDHLLADRHGYVYEHRSVLFDAIGFGPHCCHWCEQPINWRSGLEADHVDRDRANNARANLVPACHGCNSRRAIHRNQFSGAA